MIVELEYISLHPPSKKLKSLAGRIPMFVTQKKLFVIENMQIEEHVEKGIVLPKFTTGKYDNEYYKINTPYQTLKDTYYTPLVIKGYNA